jgi:hypothetical protein
MNKWNFLVVNGQLVKKLDETNPVVSKRSQSFASPSIKLVGATIYIYEGGNYATSIMFSQIGTIAGAAPTTLQDAYDKLLALIPTSSGGSTYDNVTVYDTPANLPITLAADTIHSISILSITGNTVITVGGESTTLVAGQSTSITATALIDDVIVINSASGTFLATTLS